MKKLLLSAFAVAAFSLAANAQENSGLKAGIHIGPTMGDAADVYELNFGADLAYTFDVTDQFVAGFTTGYSYYSGKEIDYGGGVTDKINGAFVPLAATAQYSVIPSIFVGADLGYALYVGDGETDGGFYYQPKVGYQHEFFEVYAAYKGISVEDFTVSSVNLGFAYKF
jgi:hypothetical protein